jgi:predicted flap endonuclease-1-like 5' DNA nuclease
MAKLSEIEGIGAVYSQKLQETGIGTTEKLLEEGASAKGRKEIAEKTGVSAKQILRWINMADLFRIKGIGQEYADLLEAAGVDTVPELSQRKPENLHKKLAEINEEKKLVRRVPTPAEVTGWVEQGKQLPRVVTY